MKRWINRGWSVLLTLTMACPFPAGAELPGVSLSPEVPALTRQDLQSFQIPAELGSVEHSWISEHPEKFVILIQDAHAVEDAQQHIRGLLSYLHEQHQLGVVGVEGARSQLDFTVLRSFPDAFARERTLREYLSRGEWTGVQMAAVDLPDVEISGLEDWALYEENYFSYLTASGQRETLERMINRLEKNWDDERPRIFSPELQEYFEAARSFYRENIDLVNLAAYLNRQDPALAAPYPALAAFLKTAASENQTEINGARADRDLRLLARGFLKSYESRLSPESLKALAGNLQAYETGQMEPGAFLEFVLARGQEAGVRPRLTPALQKLSGHAQTLSMIKGSRLFDELESFLAVLEKRLAHTPEETALLEQYRRARLLRDLSRLELTRAQWDQLRGERDQVLALLGIDAAKAQPALSFYKAAGERDAAFFRNLSELMEEHKSRTAAVIAGGFHAQGLEAALQAAGISYAIVLPAMASLKGNEHYAQVMQGKLSYRSDLKTTLYDAFTTNVARLLAQNLNAAEAGRMLRLWRDEILRNLARQGRLSEASRYTQYVDARVPEISGKLSFETPDDFKERFLKAADQTIRQFGETSFEALGQRLRERLRDLDDWARGPGAQDAPPAEFAGRVSGKALALQLPVVAASDPGVTFESFVQFVQSGIAAEDFAAVPAPVYDLPPAAPGTYETLVQDESSAFSMSPLAQVRVREAARGLAREIAVMSQTGTEVQVSPQEASARLAQAVTRAAQNLPVEVQNELRDQGAYQAVLGELRNELRAKEKTPKPVDEAAELEWLLKAAQQDVQAEEAKRKDQASAKATRRATRRELSMPDFFAFPELPSWLAGSAYYSERHAKAAAVLARLIQRVDALAGFAQMPSDNIRKTRERYQQEMRTFWIKTIADGTAPDVPGLLAVLHEQVDGIRYSVSQLENPAQRRRLLPAVLAYLEGLQSAAAWLRQGQRIYVDNFMGDIPAGPRIDHAHQRRRLEGLFVEQYWDLSVEADFRRAGLLGKLAFLTGMYREEMEGWKNEAAEIPVPAPVTQVFKPSSETVSAGAADTVAPNPSIPGPYELTLNDDSDEYGLTLEPPEETGTKSELRAENKEPAGPKADAIRDFHETTAFTDRRVMVSRTAFPEYITWMANQLAALRKKYLGTSTPARMLSLGPGEGKTETVLQKSRRFNVDGIELTPGMAVKMREQAAAQKVKIPVKVGNAMELLPEVADSSREAVYIGEGIGYYEPLDALFKDIFRVLTPNGFVAITTYPVAKADEFRTSQAFYIQYPAEHIQKELVWAGFKDVEVKILRFDNFPKDSEIYKRFEKRGTVVLLISARKPQTWGQWFSGLWQRLAGSKEKPKSDTQKTGASKSELRIVEQDLSRFFPSADEMARLYAQDSAVAALNLGRNLRNELRELEVAWNQRAETLSRDLFEKRQVGAILGASPEVLAEEVDQALGPELARWTDSQDLAARLLETAARIYFSTASGETSVQGRLAPEALAMLRAAGRISDEVWNQGFGQLSMKDYPRDGGAALFSPEDLKRIFPLVLDAVFSPLPGEPGYRDMENEIRDLVQRGIPVAVPYEIGSPQADVVKAWREQFGASRVFGIPYRDGTLDLAALSHVQFGAGYYGIFKDGVKLMIPSEQGDLSDQAFYARAGFARTDAAGGAAGFLELSLRVLSSPYLRRYLEPSAAGGPAVMSDQAFEFLIRFFNDLAKTAAIRAVVQAAA